MKTIPFAILALSPVLSFGQSDLRVIGATATQAVITYAAPSEDPCTIEVSENNTLSPIVHDVNSALFPASNTDIRALNGASVAGVRTIVIGKRTAEMANRRMYSRALRADTDHFIRVSCGSTSARSMFRTARIGGVVPSDDGFNPQAHGNWGIPDFDWNDRSQPVVDPLSGAAIWRVTDPSETGFRLPRNFTAVFSTTSWQEPNNASSASTDTLATTSSQEPLFLVAETKSAEVYGGFHFTDWYSMSNFGVRVFGRGTDLAPENRRVDLCLSVDSGMSCYTDPVQVILPENSAANVGLFPSAFPQGNFGGWSNPVPREYWTTVGKVTVSGNSVQLVDPGPYPNSSYALFRSEWVPGTKIFIASSAPTCPSNYCTIASVIDRDTLTIQQTLDLPAPVDYRSANLGVRILKSTATGSVSLSASFEVAAYIPLHQSQNEMCSGLSVETSVDRNGQPLGRTISGRLCLVTRPLNQGGRLYFIADDEADFRLLSHLRIPASIPGHSPADLPNGANFALTTASGLNFSRTDPNSFTVYVNTQGGSPALFKLAYQGDYRETPGILWSQSIGGQVGNYTDPISWLNLNRGPLQFRTQILAKTTYDETRWPALTGLSLRGIASDKAFFIMLQSTQDLPCAVFVFDMNSGLLERWFDTLANAPGGLRFAGCHSIGSYGGRIILSTHNLQSNNTSTLYGGPYESRPTHVLRNGAFSTNTDLPPIPDGSYESTCPVDIPQYYKDLGAVGNECITLRFAEEPCAAVSTANERLWTPCPSDPARSWIGVPVAAGDSFWRSGVFQDDERMMILKKTPILGGGFEVIALRDAAPGYACQKNRPRGRSCVADATQATHPNNWTARFRPMGNYVIYNPVDGSVEIEDESITRGHYDIIDLPGGRHTYLGSNGSAYVVRPDANRFGVGGGNLVSFTAWPRFANANPENRYTQSYVMAPSLAARGLWARVTTDWRHINSGFGVGPEWPGQTAAGEMTYSLEPGTQHVYKIGPVAGAPFDYKRQRMAVWSAQFVLGDKSSPEQGNSLNDTNTWRYCYALRDGECRVGSAAGDFFAVIPGLNTSINNCHTSQISYRTPCIFVTGSVQTQMLQARFQVNDPAGLQQRTFGHALTRPGAQYVYSTARAFGKGRKVLATVYHQNGWFNGPVMVDPGDFPEDSVNRTNFVPVVVRGNGQSYVEFGYADYGRPDHFFCTPRAEACRAVAPTINTDNPFYYASEAVTPASGSWSIAIPALPGRVLYFRVITDSVPGPIQVEPVR